MKNLFVKTFSLPVAAIRSVTFSGSVKLLSVVMINVTLVACQVKSIPRTSNEGKATLAPAPTEKDQSVQALSAKVESISAADLRKKMAQLESASATNPESNKSPAASAQRTTVLDQLEVVVLNSRYLENPRMATDLKVQELLSIYNRALFLEMSANAGNQAAGLAARLEKYRATAMNGCDVSLAGCKNLKFFATDAKSSKILAGIASSMESGIQGLKIKNDVTGAMECKTDCQAQIGKYYQILNFALELRNRTGDEETDFLYIKHAREYADFLTSLPDGDRRKSQAEMHGRVFETILNKFSAQFSNPEFEKFVADFKPWSYSNLDPNPFPYGTERMFNYASQNYLYGSADQAAKVDAATAKANCTLAPNVKAEILSLQAKADRFGPSFTMTVDELAKKNPTAIQLLWPDGTDPLALRKDQKFFDEYFFMVDRLFRGHLKIDEVSQVWNGSCRDQQKLANVIDYYAKFQLLGMVTATNDYMYSIYAKKDLDLRNVVQQTIMYAKDISDKWMDLHTRLEVIANFAKLSMDKEDSLNRESALRTRSLQAKLSAVRRNVKYLSVYPNMMALSYLMAASDSKLEFTTFFGGKIKIDSSSVIDSLFSATQPPWFIFGNDDQNLTSAELLFAYSYALSTGLFESLSRDTGPGALAENANIDANSTNSSTSSLSKIKITRSSSLQQIVSKYLSKIRGGSSGLDDDMVQLRARSSASSISRMALICPQILQSESEPEVLRQISVSMNIDEVPNSALFGLTTSTGSAAGDLYELLSRGSRLLEHHNTLVPRIMQMRALRGILKDSLLRQKLDAKVVAETLLPVDQEIARTEKVLWDYATLAIENEKTFGKCSVMLLKLEEKRQFELLALEKMHLERLYDDVADLQLKILGKQITDDEATAKINQINTSAGFHPGLDRIVFDKGQLAYTYTKINLLLRIKKWSAELAPRMLVNPVADLTRLQDYSTQTTIPIRDSQSNRQIISKADFVKIAMSKLNGLGSSVSDKYLDWMNGYSLGALVAGRTSVSALQIASDDLAILQGELDDSDPRKSMPVPRVENDSMMKYIMAMLDQVHITPEQKEILKSLRRPSKVLTENLNSIILEKSTGDKLGYFDRAYAEVANDETFLTQAEAFSKSANGLIEVIFEPPRSTTLGTGRLFLQFIRRLEARVKNFDAQILKVYNEEQTTPRTTTYEVDINDGPDKTFSLDRDSSGKPVVLRKSVRDQYKSLMTMFHSQRTSGFYIRIENELAMGRQLSPANKTTETK